MPLRYSILIFATVTGSFLFAQCEKSVVEPTGEPALEAVLSGGSSYFAWDSNGGFLVITASEAWEISVEYAEGSPEGWCSPGEIRGAGNKNIWINLTKNTSEQAREATVMVQSEHHVRIVTIIQVAMGDVPPVDLSKHLELPKVEDSAWLLEYAVGDFFIEYAPTKKHPKWVAWPLYHAHIGSAGRTNAWQFDLRIPEEYRPLREDFTSTNYNNRGHLCPSADRTQSTAMNAQTFMYSNMSPQMGNFNGGIWGTLETKVRDWARGQDTLYICAGGTIRHDGEVIEYTTPSRMPVPMYYFKVILRKKAATGTYDAIGFWFEHRQYTESLSSAHTKTIDQIETLTGFDFFYQLQEDIQTQVEAEFNPSAWGL
ncbi:MAG: DNA/RNA non-specific endonuclease [Prevotellaceae bacterium]|jgi:endonuclease G|nr:DNA/RNA non-specific endonuclease [Prevotellaceae bacterium]